MNMKKNDKLFVYGTLRKGASADLQRFASNGDDYSSRYLGTDRINGRLYDLGSFPGVHLLKSPVFNSDLPVVVGDVFELLDEVLIERLDAYEGYPRLYDRRQVLSATGEHVWVYVYNHPMDDRPSIPSGDWLEYRRNLTRPSLSIR